jgi:chemosensory pili system protein ChpA (sensor histidine kinase/response regulator)
MTEPLALVVYEKLLPGTQLVNRLQDLGYRVQSVGDASLLGETAEQAGPLVVFADLESTRHNLLEIIKRLRQKPATAHLPVIAFGPEDREGLQEAARAAGVTLLASEAALMDHLPELLQQALQV